MRSSYLRYVNVSISTFLDECDGPILDVRSPAEFQRGHIPGAISFPLFSDQERALVGTTYKHRGADEALLLGLDLVGPKMSSFIFKAREIAPKRKVRIHCWRGGQRSQSMAWLLRQGGMEVSLLHGGYKAYHQWVNEGLDLPLPFLILGGYTGSAKTQVLQKMKELGAQVLDLEGMAHHKGSAFGNLEAIDQPHTEHFANLVWEELRRLNHQRVIWLEDESKTIGSVYLYEGLYRAIRTNKLVFIERDKMERATFLAQDYGHVPIELLKHGFEKITKRLGHEKVQEAIEAINHGDLITAASIGLAYYDKTYEYGLKKRDKSTVIRVDTVGKSITETAEILIAQEKSWRKLN